MFWGYKEILAEIDSLRDRIEKNHEETDYRLDNIEKVMLIQENNLEKHMQRSEHLENIVETLQQKDLKPIMKHVAMVEGALKLLGILGILVSIFGAVIKLFGII